MKTYTGYAVIAQNLRSTASTSGAVLASIPEDAAMTVSLVEGDNAWLAATYEGISGFVSARNVAITDAGATCEVTGSSAYVRRTPESSATLLYMSVRCDILQLLDCTTVEGWYRVSTADGTGWTPASNLTIITAPGDDEEEPVVRTSFTGMVNRDAAPLQDEPIYFSTLAQDTHLTVHVIEPNDEHYPDAYPDWFIASDYDYTGYIRARYIGVTDAGATCTVSAETADVYVTPSTDAGILYAVENGDVLQLLDTQYAEGWYRVSTVAGTGWIQTSCVTGESEDGGDDSGSGSEGGEGETGSTTVDFTGMNFSVGDSGDGVYNYVQKPLLDNHYYYGKNPGVFDEDTMWAVKYFQYKNNWGLANCDGIADQAVLEKLNGQDGAIEAGLAQAVIDRIDGAVPSDLTMNHPLWQAIEFDASGTTTKEETIGDSGNAPASIAIVFSALLGKAITPAVICQDVMENNWRDETGSSGVHSRFFYNIGNLYGVSYKNPVRKADDIASACADGTILLVRITSSSEHNYCSSGGATYVAVYKADDNYVYLQNSNQNASSDPVPVETWDNASWVKPVYRYYVG